MTSVIIIRFCLINSWAISHFGINPVSGGSPLNERRVNKDRTERTGFFDHEIESSLIFLVFRVMNVKNIVVVIKIYRIKLIKVNCVEIFKMTTIQPR